jgi:hypothetical protein
MWSISASEPARGFSQTTSLPAANAASVCATCSAGGVQMSTISTSSMRSTSSIDLVRRAMENSAPTEASAFSSISQSANT